MLLVDRVIRSRPAPSADAVASSDGAFLVQFHNAKLVTPAGLVAGDLWMQGGAIVDPQARFWQRRRAAADHRIDCQGMLLAPGMIDVMLHGAFGVDFSSLGEAGAAAEAEAAAALALVRRRLPELGVTTFCPAVRASSPEASARLIARLGPTTTVQPTETKGALAHCAGVHLDGPFADAEQGAAALEAAGHGATARHLRSSLSGDALHEAYGGRATNAALITLAPELPGAVEVVEALTAAGVVVGIGRTSATLAQCRAAAQAGARLVSHLMSAMPPFVCVPPSSNAPRECPAAVPVNAPLPRECPAG